MDQVLVNLLNGVPIAGAVMYVWIVSDRNHIAEIKEWRKMLKEKDDELSELEKTITKLVAATEKLTFIIQNYVITGAANTFRKQNKRSEEGSGD